MKRRRLKPNDQVVIVYDERVGFTQQPAEFVEYRELLVNGVRHETPIFRYDDVEITGLQCFWVLSQDARPETIAKVQRQIPELQLRVTEIAQQLGYTMPEKVKDPQINKMAAETSQRMQTIIEKFGFDPRDETWLDSLASNDREKHWFKFERDNVLMFTEQWDDLVNLFNQQYSEDLSVEQAKLLSKKRMRYWMGAYSTRMSGNANLEDWKTAARQFEIEHRDREDRMLTWSLAHQDHFPLVKTKKPIPFWPGPYFNECVERIPFLFTNPVCQQVRTGIVLRVISYDPLKKYIRLDFTQDIREMIHEDPPGHKVWIKDRSDYDIWLKPDEIDGSLEILENLI